MNANKSVTYNWQDIQDPSAALTNPATSGPVRGVMSLEATASDNAGVKRVEFLVNGSVVATDTTAPYQGTYDTNSLSDGAKTVSARAVDTSDRVGTPSSRSMTFDNTAPGLTASGPSGQAFDQGSTQTWTLSPSDANGIASVQCSVVDAANSASYGSCSGGTTSHSVTGLAPGDYKFYARATDNAGNTTEISPRSFSISAPAGSGSSQQPSEGNTQQGTSTVGNAISDAALGNMLGADVAAAAKALAKQKLKALAKKGKFSATVHSLMAGKFTLSFKGAATKQKAAKAIVIAKGSKSVTAAGTSKVTLKLTKAGKKLLRSGKRVKGKLSGGFVKAGGGSVASSKSLTLKRR
jgi:hypothetical protein